MRIPGLMVVGTDTGVGKTYVASGVARALTAEGRRVGVLKPVATGAERGEAGWACDDTLRLADSVGERPPLERVTPLLFEEPLAPPVAARRAGRLLAHAEVLRSVFDALEWWAARAEVVIVEGVGGLLCPLAEDSTVADLAVAIDFPLLVVARRGLGTLNHSLMTVEAAHRRGLRVAGVVLSSPTVADDTGPAAATNAAELARRLAPVGVVAEIPHVSQDAFSQRAGSLDWFGLALPPRRA